jgi:hypothetical protein
MTTEHFTQALERAGSKFRQCLLLEPGLREEVRFVNRVCTENLVRALSRSALAELDFWRLFSTMSKISYAGYCFPPEIIQQTIWLYVRFTLSFRDVDDLLAERGIMVSYAEDRSGSAQTPTQAPCDLASRRSLSEN